MPPADTRVRLPLLRDSGASEPEIPLSSLPMPAETAPRSPGHLAAASEDRPLRTSSYVIRADLGTPGGDVLLVHGYTGAYDKVSRKVAAYLRSREVGAAAQPLHGVWSPEPPLQGPATEPSQQVIARLTKRGYLTRMTLEEEQALLSRIALKLHARSMHRSPDFVVMPTYGCNLRCPYCFQDHMRTDPAYRHLLTTMSPQVVDRIVKAMATIEDVHGVPEGSARNVLLFGGEPLLAENRPIVEHILKRAGDGRRARISAVTNGTDLDAYADLLGRNGITLLQITIDGVAAVHDRLRVYPGGAGSFDRIAANLSLALQKGARVRLRVNVSRGNIEGLPALAEEIVARGWRAEAGFSASVSPIHSEGDDPERMGSWDLSKSLDSMKPQHPELSMFRGPNDHMMQQALDVLQNRGDPLPGFTPSVCTAHSTMYVFDPFADIYACWERTGDPGIRMGRVTESGEVLVRQSVVESWRSRTVVSNPVCRQCRYALYCGGGCAAHAESEHGTIHSNHCDAYGRRFRTSAAAAYVERDTIELRQDHAVGMCGV